MLVCAEVSFVMKTVLIMDLEAASVVKVLLNTAEIVFQEIIAHLSVNLMEEETVNVFLDIKNIIIYAQFALLAKFPLEVIAFLHVG